MAKLSESDHIDEHVFAEELSVLHCELNALADHLRVIAIHVEDWGPDYLCDFSAVNCGSTLSGSSGEPDLIVDNNVDHSSN